MSIWYTATDAAAQERLAAAWPDAPIENVELCDMILDVSREQVLTYAPTDTPPVYEPVTLTWPTGERIELTREGVIVTATIYPQQGAGERMNPPSVPLPDPFLIAGAGNATFSIELSSSPTWFVAVYDHDGIGRTISLSSPSNTVGPYGPNPATVRWIADPAPGDGVPSRYVYAQLQQARNLWNSGRTTGEGDVGPDGYVFRPYPLDKTIKQIIRPVDGKPHVL